ncbi:MAG: PAC2 family protein [Chloroflexota bacterium]|nr:MAG: PAC2 family protein [Chloroflexota bacterium]
MKISETIGRKLPELRNPDFIVALAGWSDAAQVATGTVLYLAKSLDATGFAQIEGDQFYDFSTTRPKVTADRGLITSLQLPQTSLFYWKNQRADHDLVLLHGIEPQLHWQKFVDTILDLASMLKVRRIYALGGLYDSTPHTKEPRLSGLVNVSNLLAVLRRHNIEPINYQGPSSLHSLLLTNCAQKNVEAISLWGHAPFYVRVETNPTVCLGLVKKLTELLEIEVDTEELIKAGERLQNTLNQLLADSEELRHYIQKLEEQYEIQGITPGEPLQGADRIIKEVEDFLRDQRHRGEP